MTRVYVETSSLRSLDAIHLATMLEFLDTFPELTVLTEDHRIIDNLIPLGLLRYPQQV